MLLKLTNEQFMLLNRLIDEINRSPFTEKFVKDYNIDVEMSFTDEEWTTLRHLNILKNICEAHNQH